MTSDRISIMIVDDSPEDCTLYRRLLAKDGRAQYKFLETGSGEEGLSMLKTENIDCVLLDYQMPDMDGLEFLTCLTEAGLIQSAPVIFLTGQGSESVAVQAMKSGASDYLVKNSITTDLLARSIQFALEKRKTEHALKEAERMKGALEMAGTVCHEFNQPLQILSGHLDLLMLTVPETDALHPKLVKIQDEILRMGGLTKKLMRIVRYRKKSYGRGRYIIDIDGSTLS